MSRSVKPAALRRDEILDRALELFASRGYEATSVNQIIVDGVAERTFDTPNPEWAAETILMILGTNRSLICDIYTSRAAGDFDAVIAKLEARFTYLGTVIDRILGLPEGSVELTDRDTMRGIADAWREMVVVAA